MDLSKVVIVLGAGAHVPYGFPTGKELKDSILLLNTSAKRYSRHDKPGVGAKFEKSTQLKVSVCELIFRSNYFKDKFSGTNSASQLDQFIKNEVESFIERFAKSHTVSIDYFISRKGATEIDQIIGKALIGLVLNYHEEVTNVGYQESSWIQTIINNYIRDDYKNFFNKPPTIITFNYDRLFEHYLVTHLIYHHNLKEGDAVQLVNNLKIIHVYGSLGVCDGESFSKFTHENLSGINVVRGINDSEMEDKIFEGLYHSDKVYILGFGYDHLNTHLLFKKISGFSGEGFNTKFISSSRNLSEIDKNRLKNLFKNPVSIKFHEKEIDEIISWIEPLEKKDEKRSTTIFR